MLFLDVDRFKVVNDSLGHAAGDRLLMGLAKRLEACIRPSDTIARMGGDEFAILVEGLVGASTPVRIAQRIQQFLERPLVIDGRSLYANVSIGIAVAASGPESPDISPADLLRHADAALYRAKERGRNRFEIFDEELRASLTERLTTEVELHHALEAGELAVHYQPLLELASYAITNVEALVRWWHPRRGLLAAAEFIDVAEDSGLVVPIGLFVLETACRQQRAWARSLGDAAPAVSVNLSDRQLSQPSLVDDLRAVLERTGTDPERIWLEITESSLIDIEHSARVLRDVRDLGFHLSIDDFGTCYSSLSYLRRYPIEALKIDRSFVQGLAKDPDSDAIVTAIVTLAHALDLAVTAEGVEEHVQLDALTGIGASTVQGYLVGRPAPADEITSMLGRPVVVGSGAGSGGGSS